MTIRIAVCGCGAVGSQLALMIARPDMAFVLIDDDRIEEDNIFTTAFSRQHIGAFKAQVLGELLYRKAGCISRVHTVEMTTSNASRLLSDSILVLDCFDNVTARRLTRSAGLHYILQEKLHVGVSQDRTGAVTWDREYTLPEGLPRGQEQFCTHQVGRRIIRWTASVAANIIDTWLADNRRINAITTEERVIYA